MSEPTTLDILIAARAKIAKPENWGKGSRGANGAPYGGRPWTSFCAAEAIEASDPECTPARKEAFRAVRYAAGFGDEWGNFVDWNDAPERGHIDIIRAFNLAIATLSLGSPVPQRTTAADAAYTGRDCSADGGLRGAES